MRILVTNDDGITSRGIAELAAVAAETDLDVVIAAPAGERSGSSAALLSVATPSGVLADPVRLDAAPAVKAFSVHASPALIGVMAARGSFGPAPELVLSGINHGPNTGIAVLHSGTVGAAFTAAARGVPGIAFSFALTEFGAWHTAALVARRVLKWAVDNPLPAIVLNVNIPDLPPDELRGIRLASLAEFGAAQAQVTTSERTETVTMSEPASQAEPYSDAELLAAGWVTITPVMAPTEVPADLSGLVDDGSR